MFLDMHDFATAAHEFEFTEVLVSVRINDVRANAKHQESVAEFYALARALIDHHLKRTLCVARITKVDDLRKSGLSLNFTH